MRGFDDESGILIIARPDRDQHRFPVTRINPDRQVIQGDQIGISPGIGVTQCNSNRIQRCSGNQIAFDNRGLCVEGGNVIAGTLDQ